MHDAFEYIERIHAAGGQSGYMNMFQRVKKKVFGNSRAEAQWLLEHCQVCMLNSQNTTRAPFQSIVVREMLARVQADPIDI